MEGDVRRLTTGAGADELGLNTRALMTHLGGRSAEFEKSDQDTMGQRSERYAQIHLRYNTVSLPPHSVTTSSLYSREYGEFAGNEI